MKETTQQEREATTPKAMKRLAAATILKAVDDAQGGDIPAIEWLASSQATKYFDLLELPQSRFLMRSSWRALARPITDPSDVITQTLEYLDELEARARHL